MSHSLSGCSLSSCTLITHYIQRHPQSCVQEHFPSSSCLSTCLSCLPPDSFLDLISPYFFSHPNGNLNSQVSKVPFSYQSRMCPPAFSFHDSPCVLLGVLTILVSGIILPAPVESSVTNATQTHNCHTHDRHNQWCHTQKLKHPSPLQYFRAALGSENGPVDTHPYPGHQIMVLIRFNYSTE